MVVTLELEIHVNLSTSELRQIVEVDDDNYVKKNYQHVNVNLVNHSKPFFV